MKRLIVLSTLLACGLAFAREAPPKLLIDVDFFDNLETVRPYCGSNWIDRFFADCQAHGVKRVTWCRLGTLANANALRGNDQSVPNVCRFPRQELEGFRMTVTRGGHPFCLVIRAIQGR